MTDPHERRRHRPTGPRAGPGRRRPPQRRQVDPGQPDHRPPRGRRRGRPRGHPRPRLLRRQLERPRVHRRRHRRLGPRRPRAGRAASPPRPRSRSASPTPCSSWSTPGSGSPTPTRPSSGSCASPASRSCWPPTRSTTSAPRPRPTACGTWGWASRRPVSALHGRGSGDLLDAVLAALPETPPESFERGRRPAPGRDRRPAQRRQVLAAEQAGARGPGGRRRRVGHHRRPGRRAGRAGRQDLAVHRHRRHPQAGEDGLRATSTTPRCAPRPRSSGPRWPCWSSTARSRSPSRTCASCRRCARPAARW